MRWGIDRITASLATTQAHSASPLPKDKPEGNAWRSRYLFSDNVGQRSEIAQVWFVQTIS
jgi:hypothetical protein